MQLRKYRGPGLWVVLYPKWRGALARIRLQRGRASTGPKALFLMVLGAVFWLAIFGVVYRVLRHFHTLAEIGPVLASKVLSLFLLALASILLLSNLITALSSLFLAKDLDLLAASPVHSFRFYAAKLTETVVHSSWMVALLCLPVLAAYGLVYDGGSLYPLVVLGALVPFFLIPAIVGTAVTLLLVNVVSAQRAKEVLSLVAIGAVGILVLLLRVAQPELLVRPEGFRSLADFLAAMQAPTHPLLPSEWASALILNWLFRVRDPWPPLWLWGGSAVGLVIGAWLHRVLYRRAFSRAKESARAGVHGRGWTLALGALLRPIPAERREFLLKDARLFFRDPTQWSQLILLGVLLVVYLFNIQALPLFSGEQLPAAVVSLVVFLNLGLAGFVLAAIAVRFLFPSVSLEGRQMWLLRSSPLDLQSMFWSKYWIGTVPLVAVSLTLTFVTNLILRASPFMMAVSLGTMLVYTLTASALALSFGAFFPRFDTENAAQIPTSFGGLVYMMASVCLLAIIIMVEAPTVAARIRSEHAGLGPTPATELVATLGGVGLLCAIVSTVSLRLALKRLARLEL